MFIVKLSSLNWTCYWFSILFGSYIAWYITIY